MITLTALLLTLAGATLIYLASTRQRLRAQPLPSPARHAGWLLVLAGAIAWRYAAGVGPGLTAALTALMLAWVALPYLAWWRSGTTDAGRP